MSTRGRLISGLVTIVMALAGFVTAGALPAAAAPSSVPYVALGDSYAAGQGAPPYVPGNSCLQSRDESYPVLLADGLESRIDLTANAACSGARTSDVLKVVESPQSPLDRDTRLVTVTVGAANLGLSAVLAACSNLSTPEMVQECRGQITRAQGMLGDCTDGKSGELDSPLTVLYADIADKARGARIVVTGYPLLFDPSLANNFPFRDINEATADLNCVIERAVAATQRTYANIYYVDVTDEFAGHGIGCTDGCTLFINPPAVGLPEAFHPNDKGYAAYADAISAALPGGWVKPLA